MEHLARNIYHWLPLSLKQKTALRKFISVYLWRILLQRGKNSISIKEYYLGHSTDTTNVDYLKEMIDSAYDIKQSEASSLPLVSIIIPVHNHIKFTVRSLLSIAKAKNIAKYEIIVMDDNSDDETANVLGIVDVIRYFRNKDNIGFLRSCNLAAQHATGKYLVFLNNDTVVQDSWLDALLQTFVDFPSAGLVGSKLIYPDGRLQEAGGIIWKDGTGRNYGWGDDPHMPKYNYLREVDYCSGASIMIPREIWEQLGGFDEAFTPAYYEDTDLAFQVRQAGYKVYYQPASEVIHFEGVSSGTNLDSGVKKYQEMNRIKFVQKWKSVLSLHQDNESADEHIFRNRYVRTRILYVDSSTPAPDRDSGSIDAFQYMYILKRLGCEVSFIPASNLGYAYPYTSELQRKGIECLYHPYLKNVDRFIRTQGKHFDIVILSRLTIASQYLEIVKRCMPQAKIIFNTVDLHFLREERVAKLQPSSQRLKRAQDVKQRELALIKLADHTMVVSETEYAILSTLLPDARISVIPIPREIHSSSRGYDNRHDIVFIGGYNHSPNVDAVGYFVKEIWPLISGRLPSVRFLIAGSNMPVDFSRFASDRVILQGYVEDLDAFFSQCRLSVAPLRFGSGIKGKIITSLGYGVPCVATSVAMEGMGLVPGSHILQADSPENFADAVVEAYTNTRLWQELSINGLEAVKEKFSLDVVEEKLAAMLNSLDIHEA